MQPRSILIISLSLLLSSLSLAADYTNGDIHKNDFKWFQFNLVESINNKIPFGKQQDTFFEMEFGGRSGVLDLYGFLDILDALDSPKSDFHNSDNLFFKFVPRVSLDATMGSNLAVGPIKEWYIATLFLVADRALFQQYLGIGTDLELPWFGKVGANLMARYVRENYGEANEEKWDGYILATNWFKPFYSFANKSFMTYQGYLDYTFGATEISDSLDRSDSSIEWFNGLYWHSERSAVGYGLKYYKDMGLLKNSGVAGETSGFGHYVTLTYKY